MIWPQLACSTPITASAHIGMPNENILDFGRGDVLPATDDRVIGSPADEQVTVRVDAGHIAGGKPALGVEYRSDLDVTARHLRAAHRQLGRRYLERQIVSLGGGSTEIARNVIAERVLNLPREYAADRGVPFSQVRRGRSG
ncbi:MAG: hypothetical protein QOH07_31 [Mycobacterium sp.]|jgi:hypothetical protein|nr:hypothetical protein [Mycobacterium sp.]